MGARLFVKSGEAVSTIRPRCIKSEQPLLTTPELDPPTLSPICTEA